MTPQSPWIEAVLSSFKKDDPKNERRRDLLVEAAGAVPNGWGGESRDLPPAPASLARAARPRRFASDSLLVLAALGMLWTLWFSPDARYRLRGIGWADSIHSAISDVRLSGPLVSWSGISEFDDPVPAPQVIEDDLRQRIPPEKHAVCLGRRGAKNPVERRAELWANDPDSPVMLADQARGMQRSDQPIPDDFTRHAESVDPDNAYYRMLAFAGSARLCVSWSLGKKRGIRNMTWRIDDPEVFNAVWADLEGILTKHTVNAHSEPLVRLQLTDWPEPREFPDLARDLMWRSAFAMDQGNTGTAEGIQLMIAKAQQLAVSGSVAEMEILCDQWRQLLRLTLEQPESSWFSGMRFCGTESAAMAEVCEELGMGAEAGFFRDSVKTFSQHRALLPDWSGEPGYSSLNLAHFHNSSLDSTPGRLAEHRMFESLYLAVAATVLLLLVVPLVILRASTTHRLLGLPAHLTALLHPTDHLRVVAVGMLLPAAVVFATLEIPLLHPRDETFNASQALAVLLKLAALVTATVLLTSREILRALARRGRPLGFGPTASRLLLLLAILALAIAPATTALARQDLSTFTDDPDWIWTGFFAMPGLILVVVFTGAIVLLCTGSRRVQTATAAHLLTRHLVLAAVLLAAAVPVYRAVESHHAAHAMAERIDTPEAIDALLGRSPVHDRIRQVYLDYLATAPSD